MYFLSGDLFSCILGMIASVLHNFVSVLSSDEASALCWPQVKAGSRIMPTFLFAIDKNFLHYRELAGKSPVDTKRINKKTETCLNSS